MDRINAMRLFMRIVELGSFTKAASDLLIPRASATHAIQEMETRLRVRLLDRTTRDVRATSEGTLYYDRCLQILDDLEEAEAMLSLRAEHPQGRLRIDMHGVQATQVLLPRIAEFHRLYPDIDLVLGSGDRLVDLVREGVDCVIRSGEPQDSSLVTKRLALMPQVTCASPAYLAQAGTPRTLADLEAGHRGVNFFSTSRSMHFPFEFTVGGAVHSIDLPDWISVNAAETYVACAVEGCGIIQVPRFHVQPRLDAGTLVELLPDLPCPPMPVSVLYAHRRQRSSRVGVFVDWVSTVYTQRFGAVA